MSYIKHLNPPVHTFMLQTAPRSQNFIIIPLMLVTYESGITKCSLFAFTLCINSL
jgi:hypothetical protein